MSSSNNKRRSTVIVFDRSILTSEAYRQLTGNAVKVYIIFLGKRKLKKLPVMNRTTWVILNNGKIVFTYAEAQKKHGIARKTFSRALDQLVELGFIDIARPGIGRAQIETLYSISERWKKYGTADFIVKTKLKRINYKFPKKE